MMLKRMMLLRCLLALTIICSSKAEDDSKVFEIIIPEITQDVRYNQPISEHVSQSVMNFAHNLAVALDTDDYPNVQIFSPLSVMSALSLLQMGSYGNTFNELNQLFAQLNKSNTQIQPWKIHEEFGWLLSDVELKSENRRRLHNPTKWRSTPINEHGFGRSKDNNLEGHTIRVSNALFVQNGFNLRPDYAFAAQSVYRSEVTLLDFKDKPKLSKDYINSWVNQNTLGKIPSIIEDELNTDTEMVLASTLYFKGFWEKLFFEAWKHKEPFYPDGPGSFPVSVTYMGTGGTFPYYESLEYGCRILGLPYKGNQTTMYVIQPTDSTRLRVQQLQKDLNGERLNELISKMEYSTATVVFPKFHVTSKMQLKKALKIMGIQDIFLNKAADFSLIADPEEVNGIAPAASLGAASPISIPQQLDASAPASPISAAFGSQRSPYYSDPLDRYDEAPLIFSRFSDDEASNATSTEEKSQDKEHDAVTITTEAPKPKTDDSKDDPKPSEESVKSESKAKLRRRRRQAVPESAQSLQRLDHLRSTVGLKKPKLYVDEILHTVDFNVNEQGTEAAAATLAYLTKSGPKVTMRCDAPFLILVRHDPTKLALFYGIVNIPV